MAQRFNSKFEAVLLGQRLRAARKSNGYTLTSLAEIVGVHHSQISRIERGEMETVNTNLQKLCKYLGVPYGAYFVPLLTPTLGQRVDQLMLSAPENEGALRMLVEALEALMAKT